MEEVRVKSFSLSEVVNDWNSGSSAYWGSSLRRKLVGCALRSLDRPHGSLGDGLTFEVGGVLEGHCDGMRQAR